MTVHSLHALGVSHEDLKRSNVLVDPVGCPSLIDFGFSHFAAYGQRVRSAGGTLDYSSPQKVEVSKGGDRELKFRMGCTMAHKMMSGVSAYSWPKSYISLTLSSTLTTITSRPPRRRSFEESLISTSNLTIWVLVERLH
jgi:serine/threonine protein kinase